MITHQPTIDRILKASPQGAFARLAAMQAGYTVGMSIGKEAAYWVLSYADGFALCFTTSPDADFYHYAAKHSGGRVDLIRENVEYLRDQSRPKPRPILPALAINARAWVNLERLLLEAFKAETKEDFLNKAGYYIRATTLIDQP